MKTRYLIAAAALLISFGASAADNGGDVLKKGNCLMCHADARKGTVPGWQEIAAKYAGDKGAQAKLETKVRNGGAGAFGPMPMPATPKTVADADIKAMVSWILAQK